MCSGMNFKYHTGRMLFLGNNFSGTNFNHPISSDEELFRLINCRSPHSAFSPLYLIFLTQKLRKSTHLLPFLAVSPHKLQTSLSKGEWILRMILTVGAVSEPATRSRELGRQTFPANNCIKSFSSIGIAEFKRLQPSPKQNWVLPQWYTQSSVGDKVDKKYDVLGPKSITSWTQKEYIFLGP